MTKNIWEDVIKHGAFAQELDWFAIDISGNMGVFSAIMHAPIPEKVKTSYENYIELKQFINSFSKSTSFLLTTTEQGNFSDWTSYAEKGLFAFDFQDVHRTIAKNQYDLIARPLLPIKFIDANIPSRLLHTLVELDCDFSKGDIQTKLIM